MKKEIKSKSYNKWKIIDVVVIIAVIILSILIEGLRGTVEEELGLSSKFDIIYLFFLLIYSVPLILCNLVMYFGVRYTIKKVKKRNLSYNATKNILYYREVFNDLTPFEVSILANLNIEEKKDVAATILWYQNRGYIDIKEGQIIYNDNVSLTEKDKYFLTYLKTKDNECLKHYTDIVYEELKSKGYIVENNWKAKLIKNLIISFLEFVGILCFMGILIFLNVFSVEDYITEKIIDLVIIIIALFFNYKMVVFLMIGYKYKRVKFSRTKLGEEKTTYIHALQNFIHDFSNLKDAYKEQIVLWKDFLAYAITLEENSKIVSDISEIFKKI